MHRVFPIAAFVCLIACTFTGCSKSTPSGCDGNASCDAGWVCAENGCKQLCSVQNDCAGDHFCENTGFCSQRYGEGLAPEIQTVSGNDATDSARVGDGLIIIGARLANAVFELRHADGDVPLVVRTQDADRAELTFPADIHAYIYTLVATNAAGSDQAFIELTLPDLTGDALVQKVNRGDTVERIQLDRLEHTVQRRILGECTEGKSIRRVNVDGTVVCETDTILTEAEVDTMIAGDLSAGMVPVSDGTTLAAGSVYDDGVMVGIGTTTPLAPMHVEGAMVTGSGYGATTHNVASFFTTENSVGYVHIKTPFSPDITSDMCHFHLRGYAYGAVKVIDLTYVGYAYQSSGALLNPSTTDPTGAFAPTVYKGTDGFIYLRLGPISTYYLTFAVDSTYVGNGRIVEPGELTITRSASATL